MNNKWRNLRLHSTFGRRERLRWVYLRMKFVMRPDSTNLSALTLINKLSCVRQLRDILAWFKHPLGVKVEDSGIQKHFHMHLAKGNRFASPRLVLHVFGRYDKSRLLMLAWQMYFFGRRLCQPCFTLRSIPTLACSPLMCWASRQFKVKHELGKATLFSNVARFGSA